MIKVLIKFGKLAISMIILGWMISFFPLLGAFITFEGLLGIILGVVFVKDPTGRFHNAWNGQFVSREMDFLLKCVLPLVGITMPIGISIMILPMYAADALVSGLFGAFVVGFVGGMGTQ